jgi:predicted GNAT superfamily acetyltransferase
VLALNLEWEHVTSPLSAAELTVLVPCAVRFRVVEVGGQAAAFLLAFGPCVDYDSVIYRWFDARYGAFLYIDRVVVGSAYQRSGIGDALYADAIAFAREHGIPRVVCEVDVEPPNTASVAFHDRLGFVEIGTQTVAGGTKVVSLRELSVR